MEISFAKGSDWRKQLTQAYTFRFAQTPEFTQEDAYITTAVNPNHPEGFDNISLLTREPCTFGATATLHCGFDGEGCPEILIVPEPELCDDGVVRFGSCFEVVLWKNGVNVWRHYRDESYHWQLRMGLTFPVAEGAVHELTVQVLENQLTITLNGQKMILRTEDLPEHFHMGVSACEGIARLYDLKLENNPGKGCTAGFFNV